MKKLLFCIIAAAFLTTASAYANGIEYNSENDSVTYTNTNATDKKNVVIYNSDDDNITSDDIIYINQSGTSTFSETTTFLTKQNPKEGKYTIKMSDDNGTIVSSEFYVGMNAAANDIKMMRRIRPEEQSDTYVRYACIIPNATNIQTVIAKMTDGTYYGFKLNTTWSVGANTVLGVQFEGSDINSITDVWLSERALTVDETTGNGTLTNGTQTSNESTQEEA
jgi:hypothetical protein